MTRPSAAHAHRCPGLFGCKDHPRWRVWKGRISGRWWISPPGQAPGYSPHRFATHTEAINLSQHLAALADGSDQ